MDKKKGVWYFSFMSVAKKNEQTKTIAIIDDDPHIRKSISFALEQEFYRPLPFSNGKDAQKKLGEDLPDLIILDIIMPEMDGIAFCAWVRSVYPEIPIIFLSSKDSELDKLMALELGGDDYITKPYSMRELLTRIKVCLRRIETITNNNNLQITGGTPQGDILIDESRWECEIKGKPIRFTVTEFRIIHALVTNKGVVFSRKELMEKAYPEDLYITDRNVDTHIRRIRKKILAEDPDFNDIETIYGVGYKFKES